VRDLVERIFLLSPANVSGRRGEMLLRGGATFPLAVQLRGEGLALGEIFSFISGLYFRGKLAYARAHAAAPGGVPGVVVITAAGGLVSPDRNFTVEGLREITSGDIDAAEARYRVPLQRDARLLLENIGTDCEVVLLGSVATPKYVEPLLEVFGKRLLFPVEFVGRGDMSRGGLMLRCAREKTELTYVPVAGTVRHGARPAKLAKLGKLGTRGKKSQNPPLKLAKLGTRGKKSQNPHPLTAEGAAPNGRRNEPNGRRNEPKGCREKPNGRGEKRKR
jgi:hypothetical protein